MIRALSGLRPSLLLLVLLAVLPPLGLTVYTGLEQRQTAAVLAQEDALRLARVAAESQAQLIEGARVLLIALAQLPEVRLPAPTACSRLFADLMKRYPRFINIGVASREGDVFCSALPARGSVNIADRAYFRGALGTRGFAVGEYQIGRITGKASLNAGYPVLEDSGRVQAVVFVAMDLAWLNRLAAGAILPPGTALTVVDGRGTILARFPDPSKWVGKSMPEVPIVRAILSGPDEGTAEAQGVDGVRRLYAFTRLGGPAAGGGAHVTVGIPAAVAFAEVNRLLLRNFIGLGLVAVLAFAAAWVVADRLMLRPVDGLVRATVRLSAGDLSARAGLSRRPGELGRLAHAFDEMAAALQSRTTALEMAEETLRHYAARLEVLHEIDKAILAAQSAEAIAESAVRGLAKLVPCRLITVSRFDGQTNDVLMLAAHPAATMAARPGTLISLRDFGDVAGIFQSLGEGKALNLDLQMLTPAPAFAQAMLAEGLRRFTAVPIIGQGTVIAVLSFWTDEANALAPDRVVIAREVADQLGVALEAARIRGELRQYAALLEQRVAERTAELRDAKGFLEHLITTSPMLIFRLAPEDHRVTYISPNAQQIIGYASEEILGVPRWWLQAVHPDDRERVLAETGSGLGDRLARVEHEYRFRQKSGEYRWFHTVLRPESDDTGRLTGLLGFSLDITARKRAEDEARRLQAFLTSIVENIPSMIFVKDAADLRFVLFNMAGEELLGYSREQLIGKSDYDFFPADQADFFTTKDRDVLAGRKLLDIPEEPIETAALGRRILHTRKIPILDERGEPRYLLGISEDITARRQAEETLREREETLQAIFASSPDAISFVDAAGSVRFISPAVQEILGYAPEERLGEDTTANVHPEDQARFAEALQQAVATGEPVEIRHRRRHAKGTWVVVETRMRRMTSLQGPRSGVLLVTRDVTEKVRLEDALRKAKEDAERANQAKSDFLSRMSHELRTPLNAILGFAQLLEMDSLDVEQRESVNHILKAGRHLLELINEVLDIARIEAGRLSISLEPVSVKDAVQESLELIAPLAAEDDIRLEGRPVGARDWHVLADRQRLKQILLNLLSNAVKYNRRGGAVAVSSEEVSEGRLRISVTDTGPGISPDRMERLFIPFDRLGVEQRVVEGTGLGLALSKYLAEAMGGRLGAESTAGLGSTFWVELSLAEAPLDRLRRTEILRAPVELAASSRTRVVLYVEDNLSNLKLIQRLLAHRPEVRLLPAMQGRLGLDLAREHRPELILLDLHLPDVPGDEVLRQLRAAPETRHIPVVIISADATSAQIDRLLAAGARGYLTKPLDVRKLLALLDETLREREPDDAGRQA